MDFRKKSEQELVPLYMNGVCVERVESFKFPGVI